MGMTKLSFDPANPKLTSDHSLRKIYLFIYLFIYSKTTTQTGITCCHNPVTYADYTEKVNNVIIDENNNKKCIKCSFMERAEKLVR
jgi:hypothetical protein